jgi:hypothetical protein
MKIVPALLLIAATAATTAFADNRWIGGGSVVTTATVKAIKTRPGSTTIYFRINEKDGDYSKWVFDGTTSAGKNSLAALLSAHASGSPITFHETSCDVTWKECGVDEITLGNGVW